MGSLSKFSYWIISAAIVLGLAVVLLSNRSGSSQLPKGAVFRVYDVTHGTVHAITVGSWWERLKQWRLIQRSLRFVGMRPTPITHSLMTFQATTVFWIQHTGQGEDLSLTRSDWRASVADERGVTREVLVPFNGVYTPVMAWRTEGEPPSGKKLTLNIHMRDPARTNDWLHVAKFRIRNPAP